MNTERRDPPAPRQSTTNGIDAPLHESWLALIHFCRELQYGEIEKIKIQDGLPVAAELATRKIKFL